MKERQDGMERYQVQEDPTPGIKYEPEDSWNEADVRRMWQRDLERFAAYVRDYDPTDPRIALKIVHTFQVTRRMEELCRAEHLPLGQAYLHGLAALYHDIGRFEQVRRYHTFLDAKSLDHAQLSAEILEDGEFLDHLEDSQRAAVIEAVREHSWLQVNPDLPKQTLYMARMLRDADKLDIFRVFATEDFEVSCNGSLEQAAWETISDPVYAAVMEGRSVKKEDRRTSLDIWATFLSFFYDLNFEASFHIANAQGYFRIPFGMVTLQHPQTRERVAQMLERVEALIAQKEQAISSKPDGQPVSHGSHSSN